ncbi:VTT domain-containing protein [Niastella sp. MAH-29]|uniref:VTT domain-containing protein n=2 Tax=Chitinophagaceae TaxID=563835 RepID=A0ABS3YT64_9BACT|nr:VTT domain-containing protein [Niastella soli]
MLKRLIFLLLTVLTVSGSMAQQQIRIQCTNQYETPVSKITVSAGGQTKDYTTDMLGFTTITVNPAEPITITSQYHDELSVAAGSLKDNAVLTLHKSFTWKDLLNPMFYIVYGGFFLLLFIVFAETGLFVGFFLPGDSLLFVAGIYSANLANDLFRKIGMGGVRYEWLDLFVLIALISLAGILGNTIGYWTGKKIGPTMFHWRDRFLFKKKYLYDAHEFYEKHGGGAIVFARFLPIIRTFAPIVAGIVDMDKKKFSFFNMIGCVAWVFSMIIAGHFLQKWIFTQFNFDLKKHLELIVLGIVIVTTAPVIIKLLSGKKKVSQPPTN